MTTDPSLIALIAAVFLVAGFVKGTIGMGLPSIAIGLLAVVMPPAQAAALMLAPSFITNVWQMLVGPHLWPLIRRLWSLLVGSAIGIWLGGGVLTGANSRLAACGLGVALVIYAIVGLTAVRFAVPRAQERWWSFPVGLATGFVAGGTGVFVIPAGPYFQAINLSKDELVQMLGLSFTVSTIVLALVLWRDGVMQTGNTLGSALAVIPALLGMLVGQRIRTAASPERFRQMFFLGLLALGLHQTIRNVW